MFGKKWGESPTKKNKKTFEKGIDKLVFWVYNKDTKKERK